MSYPFIYRSVVFPPASGGAPSKEPGYEVDSSVDKALLKKINFTFSWIIIQ